jgi:thiol-disulfide isomerase/thioredoxin
MLRTLLLLFLFAISFKGYTQQVEPISKDSFISVLNSVDRNKIVVVNFWATWCRPCVEEMPYFMSLDTTKNGDTIQYIFLSLDIQGDTTIVKRFLNLKKFNKGKHYLFNETDFNALINAVNPKWQGNIPYTIVFNKGKRKDYPASFSNKKQLQKFIEN